MRHWLLLFQIFLFALGLAVITGLFYLLWPVPSAPIAQQQTIDALHTDTSPSIAIEPNQPEEIPKQPSIAAQTEQPQIAQQSAPTRVKIKHYPTTSALESNIANIDLDQFKQEVSLDMYLSYLLALEKCMPFHRYANIDGTINISPQRLKNTLNQHASQGVPDHISQSLVEKINRCNGVKLSYIKRLYQEVTYVANQGNIQAMMMLSHLPDMALAGSNNAEKAQRIDYYHKQMMWLEQARQHGSLNALFNLAVRYHHGVSPDPVSAAAYYQVLQHYLPDYQYEDTVADLTDSMKTWQKAEVEQMTDLLIAEMDRLPNLYDW
ncbi:hypothetical protein DS2_01783 [Catenovulum agarivorans DS-2]|uniref:Sel1 repeat family protein n=1 Tax=Catenovulum agarivorans DS-2 TaxID=1328313 RepID=W7QJ23_9ALTE|nr:hypothetical protein [Catenovulum agarivorans]EWH11876.1 hypothetical protein DS2_01783 [Catenovulum agarivorans DS-2]